MRTAPVLSVVRAAAAVLLVASTLTACDGGTPAPAPTTAAAEPATVATVAPTTPADPTASWTAYSDPVDHFSLRYPPAWQQRACPSDVHTGLFLAPSVDALAICNSGFVGQMSVVAVTGDEHNALQLSDLPDLVTAAVTVGGHAGTRQAGTAVASDTGVGPVAGTRLVVYVFVNGGRTYRLAYAQAPSGPTSTNVLADFDLMVTRTLTLT